MHHGIWRTGGINLLFPKGDMSPEEWSSTDRSALWEVGYLWFPSLGKLMVFSDPGRYGRHKIISHPQGVKSVCFKEDEQMEKMTSWCVCVCVCTHAQTVGERQGCEWWGWRERRETDWDDFECPNQTLAFYLVDNGEFCCFMRENQHQHCQHVFFKSGQAVLSLPHTSPLPLSPSRPKLGSGGAAASSVPSQHQLSSLASYQPFTPRCCCGPFPPFLSWAMASVL